MSHYSPKKNNIEPPMALIDTDKNGLGAGSHRQPGSAEVLLGSSLLEQNPSALIETPLQSALPNPRRRLWNLKLNP
jgi:hypothetical protein